MLKTIEQIRAHVFVGNHASDNDAFVEIHKFVDNVQNPIAHRAEALRAIAHEGMGLQGDDASDNLDDEEIVLEYLKNC